MNLKKRKRANLIQNNNCTIINNTKIHSHLQVRDHVGRRVAQQVVGTHGRALRSKTVNTKHTQHQHFTYLNVAILGIVGSYAAVLAVDGQGVAFVRLQQQLRLKRGAHQLFITGWAV
jgi:hypothetical protein